MDAAVDAGEAGFAEDRSCDEGERAIDEPEEDNAESDDKEDADAEDADADDANADDPCSPGTRNTSPQRGHLPNFPASSSRTLKSDLQAWQ